VKRLPILVKLSLLLICFSVVLSANNQGSIINDVLIIPYVDMAPVVDGSLDAEWDFARLGMRAYPNNNPDTLPGAADLSAWYMVAWNDDGFYLYGEAIDDSVMIKADPTADQHVSDSWELFFDGDNSKGSSYDSNDVQFRWIYDYDYETNQGIASEVVWAETDDGYAIEVAIPAADLADSFNVVLEAEKEIGWDVQVNDAEVEGARQSEVKWWSHDDRAWQSPSYFGTAKLAASGSSNVLQIPKVTMAPVVDGSLDAEWTPGAVPKITMPVATSNNTPNFADGGDGDLSAYYWAAWNEDGLYFYGEVVDDSVMIKADPTADEHVSDSWEIFLDGDNSKGASYDDNDVQFRWIYDYDYETNVDAESEVVWAETGTGYALEMAMPASYLADSFATTLADELVIGWEVQVNDAEVEGLRENQIKWWNHDDRAWQAPSYFGTAIFTDVNEDEIAEEVVSSISLAVAPVISASAIVSVDVPAGVDASVSLYNVSGQKVQDLLVEGGKASLNTAGLANGVYLCVLEAGDEIVSKKVSVIK
jgi:endo-1,4-beta-xylanase